MSKLNIITLFFTAIVWLISLAGASIFGALTGWFAEYVLSSWAFWPGFIIGAIAFMLKERQYLQSIFRDSDNIKSPATRPARRRSFLPFLLGLWIGSEFLDGDDK